MVLPANATVCLDSPAIPAVPEEPVPGKRTLLAAWAAFQFAFVLVCTGVFVAFKRNRKYEHLRLRPVALVVLMFLANCSFIIFVPFSNAIGHANMPCAVTLWTFLLIPSFLGTAVIGRLLVFYLLSQYSRAVAAMHERLTFDTGSSVVNEAEPVRKPSSMLYFGSIFTFVYFLCHGSKSIDPKLTPEKRDAILALLKFLVTSRGRISLLFALSSPYLVIIAAIMAYDPAYVAGCGGCTQDKTGAVLGTMIGICCVQVLFGITIAWQSRNWPDRWGQGRECRWLVFFSILGFFCFLADAFIDLNDQVFDISILVGSCFMANHAVCTVVQVYIAVKKDAALTKAVRRGSDALSSLATSQVAAPVGIEAVLADKELLAAFEKHLVDELGLESLLFIQDVAAWKSHYYDSGAASRTARSRKIVASYLSQSGNFTINVSSDILENVLQQSKLADAPFTMFDEADGEIRRLLTRGAYQRFIAKRTGAVMQALV